MSEHCEIAQYYSHSEPVARKQHPCVECRSPIVKGEKHFRYWGKLDGRMETGRQHFACMQACMLIRDKFYGGDCIGFGCLKEEFGELRIGWTIGAEKYEEPWKELRSLMAKILWRERQASPRKEKTKC